MDESYKPPFTMNEEITNLIVEMAMVGQGDCGSR